jgi:hypothetical protein
VPPCAVARYTRRARRVGQLVAALVAVLCAGGLLDYVLAGYVDKDGARTIAVALVLSLGVWFSCGGRWSSDWLRDHPLP